MLKEAADALLSRRQLTGRRDKPCSCHLQTNPTVLCASVHVRSFALDAFFSQELTDLLGDGDRDIFLLGDLGFLGDRVPLLLLLRRLSLQERIIKAFFFFKLQIHPWLQNEL